MRSWLEQGRSVGSAFLEVVRAELDALADDLRATGRRLTGAAVLFLLAAFLLFWALGVLAYAGVELLVLAGLPRWGAALTLLGALLLAAAVLALFGWLRARRLESPAATARRRWDEHKRWWEERALPGAGEHPGSDGGSGGE